MTATYWVGQSVRVGSSAGLAVIVTAVLLVIMCSLIAMDPVDTIEMTYKKMEVVMDPREELVARPEEKIIKPVDPTPPPIIPPMAKATIATKNTGGLIAPPLPGNDIDLRSGAGTGRAMAMFTVAPNYPSRALSRNIEGFVDLMFDITPTGKTENIRVTHAEPQGYFESSSVKTLAKWKYKPALEDGVPQPQKNKTTRIIFELEK